jgi:hypothetical protein
MRDFFTGSAGRFLAGFVFASVGGVAVYSLLRGSVPEDFSFLFPMTALGIVGGVLWVRRPPAFFTKGRSP